MRTLILITSLIATSAPQAGELTHFDDRPASSVEGGTEYIGILVSEQSYRKFLKDKVDARAKGQICEVDRQVCASILESKGVALEELRKIINKRNSWFERNRGSIAFVSGIVLGGVAVIATTKAVYQGQ